MVEVDTFSLERLRLTLTAFRLDDLSSFDFKTLVKVVKCKISRVMVSINSVSRQLSNSKSSQPLPESLFQACQFFNKFQLFTNAFLVLISSSVGENTQQSTHLLCPCTICFRQCPNPLNPKPYTLNLR